MVMRLIDIMRGQVMDVLGRILYRKLTEDEPSADSLGIDPEQLGDGACGCDRPRWSVLPCGHCGCRSGCDGCRVNLIWQDEQQSWCGCARPGLEVLPCGHCACGNGLCVELVANGSAFEARRKAACS